MKSSSNYARFVRLGETPDPNQFVLATYRARRAPTSRLEGTAFLGAVAAESSTGTWVDVATDGGRSDAVSGFAYRYDSDLELAHYAYPLALFELGNVSQLLTVVAGNALGLADLDRLKLLDVQLPPALVESFAGPAIGATGIYSLLGETTARPIVGAILKPKCGLSAEEHADICYAAWVGEVDHGGADGVDMVKDDEALTHQPAFGSPFDRRIELTLAALRRAEDRTGRRKIYVPNVTHSLAHESIRRAKSVRRLGGTTAMIDFVMGGGTLLHALREADTGLAIHGHRTLFAAMHRSQDFGVDYRVWAKLFRIVGGDQVHIGTPGLGVMKGDRSAVRSLATLVREDNYEVSDDEAQWGWLPQKFRANSAVLPICGAGMDPTTLRPLVEQLGSQVIMFAGGGVMGHPAGPAAGAASLRESLSALTAGTSLADWAHSRGRRYFDDALKFFGNFDKQSPNDVAREQM